MVVKLTDADKQLISSAIAKAERITSAEIAVVIAPASDAYTSHIFSIGLLAGSLIATGYWFAGMATYFPFLLFIQLSVICAISCSPILRNFCLRLIPKNIQIHRASHRAYAEYMAVSRNVPASVPVVLLYISLAEHYSHIITGSLVNEKILGSIWENVIKEFTVEMQKSPVCDSCVNAIAKISELLVPYFPAGKNQNYISDHIIETK